MRTKERLEEVLRAAGLHEMAAKALLGGYDDFETTSPTPIIDLVRDLKAADRPDLAQRAIDGEWDSTPEEADEWFEREGRSLLEEPYRAKMKREEVALMRLEIEKLTRDELVELVELGHHRLRVVEDALARLEKARADLDQALQVGKAAKSEIWAGRQEVALLEEIIKPKRRRKQVPVPE